MAIKLFVTDMDGTLLNSQVRISEENKQAIAAAMEKGVTVTIATGRMYSSALPYARELGARVPIITYDGALIKSVGGEEIFSSYIAEETVRDVLDYTLKKGWHVQIYSGDRLYYAAESPYTARYKAKAGVEGLAVGRQGMYGHLKDVPKILSIADTPEEIGARVQELQQKFAGRLSVARSNPTYLDMTNCGVNKASSIRRLAGRLGIKDDEIMAIGDSDNDLPMLKAGWKSVAMGNAADNVKAVCDYVTEDADHSGVAEAIKRYVL